MQPTARFILTILNEFVREIEMPAAAKFEMYIIRQESADGDSKPSRAKQ